MGDGVGIVLIEFWLASWLGRVWLGMHASLRSALGDQPGECALVARGEQMPAGRLWRVQDFAVRVWFRFAMAVVLLLFPFGFALGLSSQLHLHAAEAALTWLLYVMGCTIMASIAMFGLIRYRSNQNQLRWTKGLSSEDEPLPQGSDGLPRKSDFWLATLLAAAAFLILLYAGTRSPHH
ncbi:MAG: hypothetical protein J2P28_04630 [Actinobacteria bacterium]|nr:hypothetical protein [Actinomycetota bacterium]